MGRNTPSVTRSENGSSRATDYYKPVGSVSHVHDLLLEALKVP